MRGNGRDRSCGAISVRHARPTCAMEIDGFARLLEKYRQVERAMLRANTKVLKHIYLF